MHASPAAHARGASPSAAARFSSIDAMADPSSDEIDGWAGSIDGGTFFTTLDGRDEDGISPDGTLPPGDDLIERDLRRVFDLETDGESLFEGTDMDEVKLMYKLRKELGDMDFAKIFQDPRVEGPQT